MQPPYAIASEAINKALASDSANKRYLTSLGDVEIEICSESPNAALSVQIKDGNVVLQQTTDSAKAEIRVTGTAIGIAKLLFQPEENVAQLRRSGIQIEGDVTLLLELTQVSKKIDIDWEALLADKIGEAPAVILGRGVNQTKSAVSDLLAVQKTTLESFLSNTNSFVPTRNEFEHMASGVRDIHYRLDRIEAKLNQRSTKAAEDR